MLRRPPLLMFPRHQDLFSPGSFGLSARGGLRNILGPVLTLSAGPLAYTDNAAATIIDSGATVTDEDLPALDGGTLEIEITANAASYDTLVIRNQGTGAGQIGVSGSNVTYEGVTIGTWTGGTNGTTPLVITFNGNADIESAQALCRNIQFFSNSGGSPTADTVTRTLTWTITDADTLGSSDTIGVAVTRVASLLTNLAGTYKLLETLGNNRVCSAGIGPSFTDVDPDWQSVTGKIGNAAHPDNIASTALAASGNGTTLNFTGDFTIAGWFKIDDLGVPVVLVNRGTWPAGSTRRYRVVTNIDGSVTFSVAVNSTTGGSVSVAASTVVAGTWYYFVARHDSGTDLYLRIDADGGGSTTATTAYTSGTATSTTGIQIGGDVTAGSSLVIIDNFYFASRLLTDAEADALKTREHPFNT